MVFKRAWKQNEAFFTTIGVSIIKTRHSRKVLPWFPPCKQPILSLPQIKSDPKLVRPHRQAGRELLWRGRWNSIRGLKKEEVSQSQTPEPLCSKWLQSRQGGGVTQLCWHVVHHNGVVCLVTKVKIVAGQLVWHSCFRITQTCQEGKRGTHMGFVDSRVQYGKYSDAGLKSGNSSYKLRASGTVSFRLCFGYCF